MITKEVIDAIIDICGPAPVCNHLLRSTAAVLKAYIQTIWLQGALIPHFAYLSGGHPNIAQFLLNSQTPNDDSSEKLVK